MEFTVRLPRTRRQNNLIWVIIDGIMKSLHSILAKVSYVAEDYAKLYIMEMVKFHGVSLSIISDRGTQFNSQIWELFQKGLGIKVKLSTYFHPQTEGKEDSPVQM